MRFEDGDLWLTQKALGELFNTTRNNITMHLQDIYSSNELDEISTSKDFLLVQKEGNREVKRKVKYYNLDAVISVGYRVNTDRAIQFRRWATNVLKEFSKKIKKEWKNEPNEFNSVHFLCIFIITTFFFLHFHKLCCQ